VIIAVSDLHIGLKEFDKELFELFLEYVKNEFSRNKKEKNHLVLLGDIIEFSMRDPVKAIIENEDIISKIKKIEEVSNIYYLFGNHDIIVEELATKNSMFPFKVSKNITIKEGSSKYFFIHGYELDVLTSLNKDISLYEEFFKKSCYEGELKGSVKDFLWKIGKLFRDVEQLPIPLVEDMQDKLSKSPSLRITVGKIERFSVSPFLNIFMQIENSSNLVFGHTHRPFITKDYGVINLGSWRKDELIHNTFLKIEDDKVGLYIYKEEKIEQLKTINKREL
jgi:UDP-2,3-diacylglucosamine pyrophosphatase LpxH